MTITIEAVFENGILKPAQALTLAEGTRVRLTLSPVAENDDPLEEVIGVCDDGPHSSLAARHDELLYGCKTPTENHP